MRTLSKLIAAAALALALSSCTDKTDPTIGSESHFLEKCTTTRDCSDGLSCRCGRCTVGCTDDSTCSALGDGVCASHAELDSECRSTTSWTGGLCVDTAWNIGESSETWVPLGGPPGGIRHMVRVGDTVYAYDFVSTDDGPDYEHRLIARSEDGGLTWNEPRDYGLDILAAEQLLVASVPVGGAWLVLSRSQIYRVDELEGPREWVAVGPSVDEEWDSLDVDGQLIVAAHVAGFAVSRDAGVTWALHETPFTSFDPRLIAWKGKLFSVGSGDLLMSEDLGESWSRFEDYRDSDAFRPAPSQWVQTPQRLYALHARTGGSSELGISEDGVNWSWRDIEGGHNLDKLVWFDGTLLGLSEQGAVGRVGDNGAWRESTPSLYTLERQRWWRHTFDFGGHLLARNHRNDLAMRWSPERGWEQAGVGRDPLARLIGEGENVWVKTSADNVYTVEEGLGWQRFETPNSWMFAAGGTLYSIDSNDCVYRLDGQQWSEVMQWTPSGPTADCVASNAVDSHVSGLTVANGRLFVAQFQLGEWSLVDAHAMERLPLDFSADFADGGVYHTGKHAQNLWISSTLGTLFEFTDGGFVNRTPTAEDLPDMDADIISTTYLESDFDQLYTIARYRGPSSPDSTTDRWLRRTGTGWQALAELPSPGGRQLQYAISSAAPTGLFAVVDNRVWYHGQSSTDWIDLTDGLPDGEVTSVEAGEDAVYVTVGGHGVWKRAY